MNKALPVIVAVLGVLFLGIGLSWMLVPTLIAPQMGMVLLDGVGLSTQIGDLGSFFVTLGACTLLGALLRNPLWLYTALMLIGFAAAGRVLAWLFHGAALAYDMIAVEVVVGALLAVVAKSLRPR